MALTSRTQSKLEDCLVSRRLRLVSGRPSSSSETLSLECLDCGASREMSVKSLLYKSEKSCRNCTGTSRVWTNEEAVDLMTRAGAAPKETFPGISRPWRCKCLRCDRIVCPTFSNVYRIRTDPCRYCAAESRGRNRRMRIAVEAEALMLEVGLIPIAEFPGVARPWRCKCRDCGHTVSPQFRHVKRGHRCRYCSNNLNGNRRTKVHPLDARRNMLAAGLTPLERYPGSTHKWKCQCQGCKAVLRVSYSSIQQGGGGCKACAAKKQGSKRKSVNSRRAEELMLYVGLLPLESYPGALRSWRCRCLRCGRTVTPRFTAVDQGSGGCRYCAARGFHRDKPAILYLVQSSSLFAVKIGVTGVDGSLLRKNRVRQHGEEGWTLVSQWHVDQGAVAEDIESEVLNWWRGEIGAPAAVSKLEMPQGGWTETASLLFVDVEDTLDFVKRRIADRTSGS